MWCVFFFKQKTAYEMRISDWSSDVCSSDLAMEAAGGDVIVTSPDILGKISGKDNPQALVGVYRDRLTPLQEIDRASADIWIVAQSLRDPGNLGTILRTGDAVGAGGLILVDDCVDPFSVEAVRASMGALFTQKIVARSEEHTSELQSLMRSSYA